MNLDPLSPGCEGRHRKWMEQYFVRSSPRYLSQEIAEDHGFGLMSTRMAMLDILGCLTRGCGQDSPWRSLENLSGSKAGGRAQCLEVRDSNGSEEP